MKITLVCLALAIATTIMCAVINSGGAQPPRKG